MMVQELQGLCQKSHLDASMISDGNSAMKAAGVPNDCYLGAKVKPVMIQ